jgi:hypothetical protein
MTTKTVHLLSGALANLFLVAGCASTPQPPANASATPPVPGMTSDGRHLWESATEAEVAAALDKKFEEAAKSYVKLKKDGVVVFCKRYRVIGSNISTIQCITEAQLRNQVETMDDYRERQRAGGKCTLGVGCGAGN